MGARSLLTIAEVVGLRSRMINRGPGERLQVIIRINLNPLQRIGGRVGQEHVVEGIEICKQKQY